MHQDVGRLTEHPAFRPPREVPSSESVAPTNSSRADRGSLVFDSLLIAQKSRAAFHS